MKTQAELKSLKDNWLHDPCWDIEDTEGFEEYKEELKKFRLNQEREWKAREYNRVYRRATDLGIERLGNSETDLRLMRYLERLEQQVKSLEERLYYLENRPDVEKSRRRM